MRLIHENFNPLSVVCCPLSVDNIRRINDILFIFFVSCDTYSMLKSKLIYNYFLNIYIVTNFSRLRHSIFGKNISYR